MRNNKIILASPIIIYNHRTNILENWNNMIQMPMMVMTIIILMPTYQKMTGQMLTIAVTVMILMTDKNMTLTLMVISTINLRSKDLIMIVNLIQMIYDKLSIYH